MTEPKQLRRKRENSDEPHKVRVTIAVTPQGKAYLESLSKLPGYLNRSATVDRLLRDEAKRKGLT